MNTADAINKIEEMLKYDEEQVASFSKNYSPETNKNQLVRMFLGMKARDLRIIRRAMLFADNFHHTDCHAKICSGGGVDCSIAMEFLRDVAKEIEGK